jgi:FkbM family methyltransferase
VRASAPVPKEGNHILALFKRIMTNFSGDNKMGINHLLSDNPLYIVDVGARDGMHSRWNKFTSSYKGILFEPDPKEYKLLKSKCEKNLIVLNFALSDSVGELDFHLCQKPYVSSVYLPNIDFLNKFPEAERFDVVKSIKVQTDTLDNQLKKNNIFDIDFMKIDTQGHELSILQGSFDYLDNLVGLEIEVEFMPLYKKQPLFNEVNSFIRKHGFELFDLKRYYWKRKESKKTRNQKGQLVFGDALYFKTPEQVLLMNRVTQEKIVRSICVYLVYGYLDLAQALFSNANKNRLLAKEVQDEVVLILSKYERAYTNILPNFKGKGSIKLLFERIGNMFDVNSWYTGGDNSIGNNPGGPGLPPKN